MAALHSPSSHCCRYFSRRTTKEKFPQAFGGAALSHNAVVPKPYLPRDVHSLDARQCRTVPFNIHSYLRTVRLAGGKTARRLTPTAYLPRVNRYGARWGHYISGGEPGQATQTGGVAWRRYPNATKHFTFISTVALCLFCISLPCWFGRAFTKHSFHIAAHCLPAAFPRLRRVRLWTGCLFGHPMVLQHNEELRALLLVYRVVYLSRHFSTGTAAGLLVSFHLYFAVAACSNAVCPSFCSGPT